MRPYGGYGRMVRKGNGRPAGECGRPRGATEGSDAVEGQETVRLGAVQVLHADGEPELKPRSIQ